MLRTVGPQDSLFELLLPAGMRVLSDELARVDATLDDPVLLVAFKAFFVPTEGRPSIPMETYVRMLFLKFRYGLGYEALCVAVEDSLSWRRFCRIGLQGSVPDESTIRKITRRCGPELVERLNDALLVKAHTEGHVNLDRVRVDTTVVEADIKYPTDSGLLTKAVTAIAKLCARIGKVVPVVYRNRAAQARTHSHSIGAWLRRRSDEAKAEVLKITGLLADLADAAADEADIIVAENRRRRRRRLRRLLDRLAVLVERTRRLITQARTRVDGDQPAGATRLVSLHEPDARPIRKGRLNRPVEFGYKAQVADNSDGLIVDYSVHIGNPNDGELLAPAVARIVKLFGTAPEMVTADRGYRGIDNDLTDLGVSTVVIPRTGKPSAARKAVEHASAFVAAVKWRTGCEGRISHLKRDRGWRRTRLTGHAGTRIWCGHGVYAHNIVKLTQLRT